MGYRLLPRHAATSEPRAPAVPGSGRRRASYPQPRRRGQILSQVTRQARATSIGARRRLQAPTGASVHPPYPVGRARLSDRSMFTGRTTSGHDRRGLRQKSRSGSVQAAAMGPVAGHLIAAGHTLPGYLRALTGRRGRNRTGRQKQRTVNPPLAHCRSHRLVTTSSTPYSRPATGEPASPLS
jgi:hypothetical protein